MLLFSLCFNLIIGDFYGYRSVDFCLCYLFFLFVLITGDFADHCNQWLMKQNLTNCYYFHLFYLLKRSVLSLCFKF